RRGDAGAHMGALRAAAQPGRTSLCRPFGACHRHGQVPNRRAHHLPSQGRRSMSSVKALVVDDSATMRSLISAVLRRDPEISVVGQAGDPLEAREAIKQLNPDVITLDVEMPNMNGLAFLEKIMRLRPMPVVMVSTLTQVRSEEHTSELQSREK